MWIWTTRALASAPTRVLAALTLTLLAAGCGAPDETGAPSPPPSPAGRAKASGDAIFVDRAAESGLDFVQFNGMTGEYHMAEVTGSGGALVDVDADGDLDAYLVQGTLLGRGKTMADAIFPPRHPEPLSDRLYLNDLASGEARFTDATATSGLERYSDYGMAVAAGDVDNDGDVDLYVTNWGPNRLLRNDGPGAGGRVTFTDVADESGLQDARWSVPAVFFDYDRDGWLDLYVGNYIAADLVNRPICKDFIGAEDYCGPGAFTSEPDRLFRNLGAAAGGIRFEDVTEKAGLVGPAGAALGAVAADFDGDGRVDLYVANDSQPNNLWIQQADGTFRDEALLAGCSVNAQGKAEASMGVDAADVDNDGDLDLFMTHLTSETNTLYVNDGRGLFDDRTVDSGLGPASRPYTSFGTAWLDVDNDGWLDLLVVNGAVKKIEALARAGDPFPVHQPNQLFLNRGGAEIAFEDATARAGEVFELSEVSRGAAFGDVDNDGDTDVLLVNNAGPARLLTNQVGQRAHWLGLRLVGGSAPGGRDMLGAMAAVERAGRPALWRRVRTDGSFASSNDPRLLFGLGDDAQVDRVRVRWPDGTEEVFTGVAAGRYTTLRQGEGTPP